MLSQLTFCMLLIELGLVIAATVLALVYPNAGASVLARFEQQVATLAQRPAVAVVISGIVALALRAAVLPILPIPYPGLQDEFSYQLLGDTLAHGRLTNLTHPLWQHFEYPTIIQHPTYCSMYYPAQGLFLALGQAIAGHPFWGVWLSVGLMCGAICWMLQAWVPPGWALVGGLLAAIRLGIFSYWANSYWGGAVTALGGALVLGSLPRIKRSQQPHDAVLMGVGLVLLGASRPYEGVIVAFPVLVALGLWFLKARESGQVLLKIFLPLACVVFSGFLLLLYYFCRTTGNPFLPPYITNLRTYAVDPNFFWMKLRPIPQYSSEAIRQYWAVWDVNQYEIVRHHPIVFSLVKLWMLWFFFLGPLLSMPFLALGLVLPYGMRIKDLSPGLRSLLLVCAANLLAMLLAVPVNPHYAAPMTCAIYALVMMAMMRIREWRPNGRPTGQCLVRAVPTIAVLLVLIRIAIPVFHLNIRNSSAPWTWASPWNQLRAREMIEKHLQSLPGEHLVIVRYSAQHDPREGWAANSADIDRSRIVWAQDMGSRNQELIEYFKSRHAWLLEPDQNPIRLVSYPDVDLTSSSGGANMRNDEAPNLPRGERH